MINLDELTLRQLQLESARIISTMNATNHNLSKFNKLANHDSVKWYKALIEWYIREYGDLPSKTGPGHSVKCLYQNV